MKDNEFDFMPIRNRLLKLKEESGLKAIDFCQIYAPEISKKTEHYAESYISALFSGRIFSGNKPLNPDIPHLLNIVNSKMFPNVTLDYLIYGDETPAKIEEKLNLNVDDWTVADFCLFLGRLMDKHPSIKTEATIEDVDFTTPDGEEFHERNQYFAIKIPTYESLTLSYSDLGNALAEFASHYEEMRKITSDKAREVMYEQMIDAISKDERYSKVSLASNAFDHFRQFPDENCHGPDYIGLKIN